MTIDEGFVNNLNGGNILNEGELFLFSAAVTGGFAQNGVGGGIANSGGNLLVSQSLIEGNCGAFSGGGIDNAARSGTPGAVDVIDSTISGNSGSTGSAIQTGNAGNSVQLNHVTVAGNAPGIGLTIATTGQTVEVRASIFSTPGNTNCGTVKPTDMGYNVESADTCTFRGTGSQPSVNAQLSGGLTNAGGPTDVFTIAPTSPAANAAAECGSIFDQRGYTRGGNGLTPCDAGAYEIDGQPPAEGGGGDTDPHPDRGADRRADAGRHPGADARAARTRADARGGQERGGRHGQREGARQAPGLQPVRPARRGRDRERVRGRRTGRPSGDHPRRRRPRGLLQRAVQGQHVPAA